MSINRNRSRKVYSIGRSRPVYVDTIPQEFSADVWIDGDDKLKTTGSVSIDSGSLYATDHGTDNYFYVSGTIGVEGSLARKSVFGGDVRASGTLTVSYLSQSNFPVYSCYTTQSYLSPSTNFTATTWTNFTNVVTHISETVANGITRASSSFTVNRTGYYQFYSYFNANQSSQYFGLRLLGPSGTLAQRTVWSSTVATNAFNALFHVLSGSSFSLQYCLYLGVAGQWGSLNPIDGENMVTGNIMITYVA